LRDSHNSDVRCGAPEQGIVALLCAAQFSAGAAPNRGKVGWTAGAGGRREGHGYGIGADGVRFRVGWLGLVLDDLGPHVGGQKDAEDGSVTLRRNGGAELNLATVTLDDGTRHPEAQASAPLPFGGEERLAEAMLNFGRDAGAVVADGYAKAADAGIGPAAGGAYAKAEAAVGR
jgi:hypothetical protein